MTHLALVPVPPVAHLDGVSQHYGKTVALNNITLDIPARCMVGLIGPDGVGKSSLLSLISGARVIEHGNVMVLGGDMRDPKHRRDVCPRIAWMPQGLGKNLYHTLSVYENVDFFARLFGHDKAEREARITELLNSTGLAPFRDRPAGKLSGGMKQKLGLCCALIHDPELLILDEPTTGVDPLSRAQFWDLINSIRQRQTNMSVLVATAYMEEAERFDWLVAMNAGEVLATPPVRRASSLIFSKPAWGRNTSPRTSRRVGMLSPRSFNGIARMVRTFEVMSSPVVPSPRVAALTSTPFS